MARLSLGLDISDERATAVLVEEKSSSRTVIANKTASLAGQMSRDDSLSHFLSQFEGLDGRVVLGLPLGCGSLRNINLPFQDKKQIEQTLNYELDELLPDAFDASQL